MPRRARHQKPLSVSEALNKIRGCSKHLKALGQLNKTQARQYRDVFKILNQVQESIKRNNYKLFLRDLFDNTGDVGPILTMLCAVALGQANIAHMNKPTRSTLLGQLKSLCHEFDDPILRLLSSTHELSPTANDPKSPQRTLDQMPRVQHNNELQVYTDHFPSRNEESVQSMSGERQLQSNYMITTNENASQLSPKDVENTDIGQLPSVGDGIEQGQAIENGRQITFMFSRAPTSHIPLLSTLIPDAVQTSRLWMTEREANEPRTGCLTTMIPRDENADISITLWVGQEAGMDLLKRLDMQPTWSALLGHLSL